MLDIQAEYDMILEHETAICPVTGKKTRSQSGTIHTGFTRAQVTRMFDRRTAVQQARRTPYKGTRGEMVATGVDNFIADGFTEAIELPRGRIMLRNKEGESYTLAWRVECNYARVLFDLGKLARNY